MVEKYENIINADQYKGVIGSDADRKAQETKILDDKVALFLNNIGANPDGAEKLLHQPTESPLIKIVDRDVNSQALPFSRDANTVVSAANELKNLDSDNAHLIAKITHLQAEIAKMSSHNGNGKNGSGAALMPPSANMSHSDLKALLGNVMSTYREVSQAEGHHHDDSSVLGTVVTVVAGGALAAANFVFSGATTTATIVGGKLAGLFGLVGDKELDHMALEALGGLSKQNLASFENNGKAANANAANMTV